MSVEPFPGRDDTPVIHKRWSAKVGGWVVTETTSVHPNCGVHQRYRITCDDLHLLYRGQQGLCGICRAAARLYIDHDHASGDVRGLVCAPCNWALHQIDAQKTPEAFMCRGQLDDALAYISRARTPWWKPETIRAWR